MRIRGRSMVLLSFGHACVDVYQGAVPALVPFLIAERSYTYAEAAGVVFAVSVLSSLTQPLVGALTDRFPMPWLLPVSTVLAGVGIGLIGLSDSPEVTLACAVLAGLGIAAYHPESARVARLISQGGHMAMSWFSLGGTLGFTAAPILVAMVVTIGGLGATPLLAVPAIIGAITCVPVLRSVTMGPRTTPRQRGVDRRDDPRSFGVLTLAVMCRSIVFFGLSTFVTVFAIERTGGGPVAGTVALVLLYAGGAVGTVLGGRLAVRWERVIVARRSYLFATLSTVGVVFAPGPALYVFVVLAAIGLYVPFSLQVTLGQDYLPSRIGTAGGVTLGLTISIGGLSAPAVGAIADATSLQTALAPLIGMPLLAWLLFRTLREPPITVAPSTRQAE